MVPWGPLGIYIYIYIHRERGRERDVLIDMVIDKYIGPLRAVPLASGPRAAAQEDQGAAAAERAGPGAGGQAGQAGRLRPGRPGGQAGQYNIPTITID